MRVALVGHSQVPDFKSYHGVEVITAKVRGGHIADAYHHPISTVIESSPDAIFVWFGGNELLDQPEAQTAAQLVELVNYIRNFTAVVFVLLVEHRRHKVGSRFFPYKEYCERAKRVNKMLKREVRRNHQFHTVNIASPNMADDSRDGVHFGPVGKAWVINKLKAAIRAAQRAGEL